MGPWGPSNIPAPSETWGPPLISTKTLAALLMIGLSLAGSDALRAGDSNVWEMAIDPIERRVWCLQDGALLTFLESSPSDCTRVTLDGKADRAIQGRLVFDQRARYFKIDRELYVMSRTVSVPGPGQSPLALQPAAEGVSALGSDGRRTFAVVGSRGLVSLDGERMETLPWASTLPAGPLLALACNDRIIAVAHRDGVHIHDFRVGRWSFHAVDRLDCVLGTHGGLLSLAGPWLLVATGKGVERFNMDRGSWERFDGEEKGDPINVVSMAQIDDQLWFSTYFGLYRQVPEGWTHQTFTHSPYGIAADSRWIWVATHGSRRAGLYRLDRATGRWRRFDPRTATSCESIFKMALGRDRVFMGTSDGLCWLDVPTGVVHPLTSKGGR